MTRQAAPMAIRGIHYDTGTSYGHVPTRPTWNVDAVEHDLRAIRDDLSCTAVNLYGTDLVRLAEAAHVALDLGLDVWLQPRLIDHPVDETLDHLATAADAAQRLRDTHPPAEPTVDTRVVLNIGCEWSVFTPGIIPGSDYAARAARLARPLWWPVVPWFNHQLNRRLREGHAVARARFSGPISYSAGLWERVDWTRFDLVGLNYYRLRHNRSRYAQRLQRWQRRHPGPVVITEFGCGSFVGAADLGPESHTIANYGPGGPVLTPGYMRDEQVQADYLADLLGVFCNLGVHGAFVFEFSEPYKPHHLDPASDLDMSGYGIVKVITDSDGNTAGWEPKAAFDTLAGIHRELAAQAGCQPIRCGSSNSARDRWHRSGRKTRHHGAPGARRGGQGTRPRPGEGGHPDGGTGHRGGSR